SFEAQGAILQSLLVVESGAIAREANQVRHAGVSHLPDALLVSADQPVVMLDTIPRSLDAAQTFDDRIADHGARQAVLLQCRKIRRVEQFNGGQPHFLTCCAKLFQLEFVAPFADGVVDVPLERGACRSVCGGQPLVKRGGGGGDNGGTAGEFAERRTAGDGRFHKKWLSTAQTMTGVKWQVGWEREAVKR